MSELINILIATGIIVLVAILAGVLLSVAQEYLEVNDKSDELIDKIEFYLPSYNCGACGKVNCRQVAKGIVNGEIKELSICKVVSKDNINLIKEYCKENNIEIK